MAEQVVVADLVLRKHIRKYLLRKFNGSLSEDGSLARELSKHIAGLLAIDLLRVLPQPEPHYKKTHVHVLLGIATEPDLEHTIHNSILDVIENSFVREFNSTVDTLHLVMRTPMQKAIITVRRSFGITEADYPLLTSMRQYQRHLVRTYPELTSRRKRGRPRKPKSALTPHYRNFLERQSPPGPDQ